MQSIYLQRLMKIIPYWGFGKTKPIKANNQSSLITNHLEGKPNSPIVQTNVTLFAEMNYAIFDSLTKVKNKPNSNPILPSMLALLLFCRGQSQFWANIKGGQSQTNPKQTQFGERPKLMQNLYLQRIMKKYADMGYEKQSQSKPKQRPDRAPHRCNKRGMML